MQQVFQCYLEEAVPWIVVFWCLANCLEMLLKDALASTFRTSSTIDDMLMRVHVFTTCMKSRLKSVWNV